MEVTFEHVDPEAPDALAALGAYFAELDGRFVAGFVADAAGAAHDSDGMRPPAGTFVVIRAAGTGAVVGCGGVQRVDDLTAEIKRMWIDGRCRGQGLGRALLAHLERRAADLGRARVVLDTNQVLTEAVALYERAGYQRIERYNDNPYAHHWFAKDLST